MALENPFFVIGKCYLDGTEISGAWVTIYNDGKVSGSTDNDGYYGLNIQDITNNGETIYISGTYEDNIPSSSSWVVDIGEPSYEQDLYLTTPTIPHIMYVDDIRWWSDRENPSGVKVRPFCGIRVSDDPTDVVYKYGDWQSTGSTYTCDLNGNNFIFSVDDVVKQTWDVHNYTFDGNFKFGTGHSHTWDNLRIGLIDAGFKDDGDITDNGVWISGNIPWFAVYYSTGTQYAAYSDDGGSNWTTESDKSLVIKTGWDFDYLKGEASSQSSIDNYGLRFYKEQQPLLTKQVDVDNYADEIISEYADGKDKGNIIIDGRVVNLEDKFSISSSYLDIDDDFEIMSYEHSINSKGWNTSITYGEVPFSVASEVNKNTQYRKTGD